jgi:DNA 3'-phosphatase
MKKYKILFADLDDTLIKTKSGKTFAQGIWDMELKFDVLNKIKELEPEFIFIVTNQGGIGKFITESDFNKKLDYIEACIRNYIKHPKFAAIQSMYCDSMDKEDPFRKPNPGMINYFISEYKLLENGYTLDDMLMIGDASGKEGDFSDSDIKSAKNANINYLDVDDFLKCVFL